jgi:murein DD-endopeptidase MepM/ murein hydrolase activator NlpD
MSKLELFYPLDTILVTQGFGENLHPLYASLGMLGHNGIDFCAMNGTPIRAAHDGIVTFAGEDGSAGLGSVLRT